MTKLWITIEDIGDNYQISDNATGEIIFCEKGRLNETILKMQGGDDNEL